MNNGLERRQAGGSSGVTTYSKELEVLKTTILVVLKELFI